MTNPKSKYPSLCYRCIQNAHGEMLTGYTDGYCSDCDHKTDIAIVKLPDTTKPTPIEEAALTLPITILDPKRLMLDPIPRIRYTVGFPKTKQEPLPRWLQWLVDRGILVQVTK